METISVTLTVIKTVESEDALNRLSEYSPQDRGLALQLGVTAIESCKHRVADKDASSSSTDASAFAVALEGAKSALQSTMSEKYEYQLAHKDLCIQELRTLLRHKDEEIIDQRQKNTLLSQSAQMEAQKMYEATSGHKIEMLTGCLTKLDQEVSKVQELFVSKTKKGSLVTIGMEGENKFRDLATDAFRFFDQFDLLDVSSKTGKGDFHLTFKEFSVLVDVKNGDNVVDNPVIEKTRRDLLNNEMMFGWLVSLNTPIRKFDKFPLMVEWLRPDKCLIHVNALLKHERPDEFLHVVWNFCQMITQLVSKNDAVNRDVEVLFTALRKLDTLVKDEASALTDLSKAMDRMKETNRSMKETIKDQLNEQSTEIMNQTMKPARKPRAPRAKPPAAV